jgi:hypothetical protein
LGNPHRVRSEAEFDVGEHISRSDKPNDLRNLD